MIQLRLLLADWCLGLALTFAGHHWSVNTLQKFQELGQSIKRDME